jgi:general secretion pathway protein G
MQARMVVLFALLFGGLVASAILGGCDRDESHYTIIRNVADVAPSVVKALDRYKKIVGHYPSTADGLEALVVRPLGLNLPDKTGQWPLVDEGALRDPFGNPFYYECPGTHNPGSYDLWYDEPPDQNGVRFRIDNWSHGAHQIVQGAN